MIILRDFEKNFRSIDFLKKFSKEEFEHLTQGWKNKMEYIAAGDHKWGLFRATKAE